MDLAPIAQLIDNPLWADLSPQAAKTLVEIVHISDQGVCHVRDLASPTRSARSVRRILAELNNHGRPDALVERDPGGVVRLAPILQIASEPKENEHGESETERSAVAADTRPDGATPHARAERKPNNKSGEESAREHTHSHWLAEYFYRQRMVVVELATERSRQGDVIYAETLEREYGAEKCRQIVDYTASTFYGPVFSLRVCQKHIPKALAEQEKSAGPQKKSSENTEIIRAPEPILIDGSGDPAALAEWDVYRNRTWPDRNDPKYRHVRDLVGWRHDADGWLVAAPDGWIAQDLCDNAWSRLQSDMGEPVRIGYLSPVDLESQTLLTASGLPPDPRSAECLCPRVDAHVDVLRTGQWHDRCEREQCGRMAAASYATWIAPLSVAVGLTQQDGLRLIAPTQAHAYWVHEHYMPELRQVANRDEIEICAPMTDAENAGDIARAQELRT